MAVQAKTLKFKSLWDNFPDDAPCDKQFSNQCAIRVGTALAKSGIKTTNIVRKQRHCWHHKDSEGHILAAAELADGLNKFAIAGVQKSIELTPENFKSKIAGKTGIIYFQDYWERTTDKKGSPTGDHIDLWNGSRISDWTSWIRIQMNIVIPGVWSDLENSKRVLFWQVGK